MRFDLHIHTCLSPCADLEMAPRAIVKHALEAGLGGIATLDHNSARNAPALAAACAEAGLPCLHALEITTAEEAHVLAIFDTVAEAQAMTETAYAALPKRANQPDVFGLQPIVNIDEEVEEMEWRLLAAPVRLPLREVAAAAHCLGGLFIAAHIDRPVASFFSQLGVLSGDEGFDAMELSAYGASDEWRPRAGGLPFIRSSDSHYLHTIGKVWSEADLPEFSVCALREALRAKAVRLSPPLTRHAPNAR